LITQTDCSSVLIEVGGMAVRVRADDSEFLRLLEIHYAGFLSSDQQPEADFDVEIRGRNFDDTEPDVNVTTRNGRWKLTRGDFRAEWEPAKRHGHIVQMANPYGIDSVLRIVHSLIQADRGGFLLHSASAVRNGKAFLFAGESGAGKTTISRLAPADAELLTDEISYVRRQGDTYVAFGTPFTGELGKPGQNISAPIAALYLLAKGSENRIDPIEPGEAVRALLANVLFFAKDEHLVRALFDSGFEFVKRVPVSRLTFVPDARAWELIG
jgi:hypothetical protein